MAHTRAHTHARTARGFVWLCVALCIIMFMALSSVHTLVVLTYEHNDAAHEIEYQPNIDLAHLQTHHTHTHTLHVIPRQT